MTTKLNWLPIYNRLFEIINTQGDSYYTGPMFLGAVSSINYNLPTYKTYIDDRVSKGKSTSRKDYFYDLLMEQPEDERVVIVNRILDDIGHFHPEKTAPLRALIAPSASSTATKVLVPDDMWNADRLREYLERMDLSIDEGNYEYALTLAYTCLEGFFKSFIKDKIPTQAHLDELNPMAVQVRKFIKEQMDANGISYPDQVVILISTITNAICNARNNFSDSHNGDRAEKWVAEYLRDNVNAIARLLLNFL